MVSHFTRAHFTRSLIMRMYDHPRRYSSPRLLFYCIRTCVVNKASFHASYNYLFFVSFRCQIGACNDCQANHLTNHVHLFSFITNLTAIQLLQTLFHSFDLKPTIITPLWLSRNEYTHNLFSITHHKCQIISTVVLSVGG